MVKVEVGGQNILEIPGVDIPERKIGKNTHLKHSFTNNNGTSTTTGTKTVNFSWSSPQRRLVVTSDTEDFDEEVLSHFKEEGFEVTYLPYSGSHAGYERKLQHFADPLEFGEKYAIVAYGDAAALVLETVMKPAPKLCAVVAYYPPYMPKTSANFPPTLDICIHLAASQKFGTRHQQNYRYPDTQSGFAESDLEEFNKSAARVAWSRTLTILRKGFNVEADLEAAWSYHLHVRDDELTGKDEDNISDLMKTMTPDCVVNHVPTMTGGSGQRRLKRFYSDFFSESRPADFKTKLVSRTVGTDRIADELFVSFTHNTEMHWMLPGIPPTGKQVEVAMVVIVAIRGGRICAENVYWDQASVLFQIGLLDPKYVPSSFKTKEEDKAKTVEKVPVLGSEAAKKVLDDEDGKSNRLIASW